MPIGTVFGFSPGDSVDAPNDQAIGFLDIYRSLPDDEKWQYPDGSPAPDPYTSGASRSFSGKLVARVLGEELGRRDIYPMMQPQNPYWRDFFVAWAKKNIDLGADLIFFDSPDGIFAPFWHGGWGCSDTWEGRGFQEHLRQRMTGPMLTRLGVETLETFCLRDYVSRKYDAKGVESNEIKVRETFPISWPPESVVWSSTNSVMEDPIVKEYLLYWYLSVKEFVQLANRDIRAHATESERDVFLTMNGFETWTPESGHGVVGILLAPYFNSFQIERNTNRLPPFQGDAATCKAGLATVRDNKPVWFSEWTLWFANPYSPEDPPNNVSTLLKTKAAEAFASGCVRLVPFGTGSPGDGWPPDRLIHGPERGELAEFYRFIDGRRDLFRDAESTAKVALVYGLPTVVWNNFPTLGVRPSYYKGELGGWARALEMLHIPYDVVLLNMDPIFEHEGLAGNLDRYDVVLAPGAEHVSDEDLEALSKFLDAGGTLVTTSDFARKDELNNARNDSSRIALVSRTGVATVESGLGFNLQESLTRRHLDKKSLGEMSSIFSNVVPSEARVETNGTETLLINPVIQRDEKRLLVHLINYDYGYDANRDWTNRKEDLRIALPLPKGFAPSEAKLITPDDVSTDGFTWTEGNGSVRFHMPELDLWNIIVLEGR